MSQIFIHDAFFSYFKIISEPLKMHKMAHTPEALVENKKMFVRIAMEYEVFSSDTLHTNLLIITDFSASTLHS